ncbi:MAG: DNA internalization-related competence protein ComEC/Rec2 [Lachnospiraceae bacterium]
MIKRPLLCLCLLFMAAIWLADALELPMIREAPASDTLHAYMQTHKTLQVSGTVYKHTVTSDTTSFYLRNSSLLLPSGSYPIQNIRVFFKEKHTAPVVAVLLLTGRLSPVAEARNPGGFDSALYYRTQHIGYLMNGQDMTIQHNRTEYVREQLSVLQGRMKEILLRLAPQEGPLLAAMLLGDKSDVPAEDLVQYQMAGISHVIAISGMHLSILGMGLFRLLQRVGAYQWLAGSCSILMLLGYAVLTGESVSAMRALIMFSLAMTAKIAGRSYDLLSAAALAAILLLIESPAYLFYSGFLLTFAAVAAIGLVYMPLHARLKSKKKIGKMLLDTVILGSVLHFVMWPVLLYFFYETSVYGIPVNVLLQPTFGIVLVSALAGTALGAVSLVMGTAAIFPARVLIQVYQESTAFVQSMPYCTIISGRPDLWQIGVYYLLLLAMGCYIKRSLAVQKSLRIRQYACCVLLLMTAVVFLLFPKQVPFSITNLDVGQGDAAVLQTPQKKTYLIDGGSSNLQDVGRYQLLPFLKSQGVRNVACIFVSHADADHVSGILEVLQAQAAHRTTLRVEAVALPAWEEKPELYGQIEELAAQAGCRLLYLSRGMVYDDGEVRIQVLAPAVGAGKSGNEGSAVLWVQYQGFDAVFTGDIGTEEETELLPLLEQAEYLKVAHHGSKNSTSEVFLERLHPQIAVISCSASNSYGHPHPDTLARLQQSGTKIYSTKDRGAITTEFEDEILKVTAFLPPDT